MSKQTVQRYYAALFVAGVTQVSLADDVMMGKRCSTKLQPL